MPFERHRQRQREHERGDARRRSARRLNQAVGGEGAFDGPQPSQQRPRRAREPQRQQRAEQKRRRHGGEIPRIEQRPRSARREQADRREHDQRRRQAHAHPALAGRQDVVAAFLQRMNRIEARRIAGREDRRHETRPHTDGERSTRAAPGLDRDGRRRSGRADRCR